MYTNGQTLRHKETNQLIRLDYIPGEMWAWEAGKETVVVNKHGLRYNCNINDYIHIEDELGRPYLKWPAKGQFVDESAEKYLVSNEEMARMRQKKLREWEAEVLYRMRHDAGGRYVSRVFADGSHSLLFEEFFLKRREAEPMYRKWSAIEKKYVDGPMIFRHTDSQLWMYDARPSCLTVIEPSSMNIL